MSDYVMTPKALRSNKAMQVPKLVQALVRDTMALERAKALDDNDGIHLYTQRVEECEEALEKVLISILDL